MRTNYFILSVILGLTSASSLLAGVGEITEATIALGARPDGSIHAWLFLTDKPRSLALASDRFEVSEASRDRRGRRSLYATEQLEQIDRSVSLDYLARIRSSGVKIRRVSRWLNAVSVEATMEQLASLADLDFVSEIKPVRQTLVMPEPQGVEPPSSGPLPDALKKTTIDYGASAGQLIQIGVPAVHDLGYSGAGIKVLMLDTGFFQGHESIDVARIIAQYDFIENDGNTQNETDNETKSGQHNHGTYTYSTLGGNMPGKLVGPAFDVSFLLAKTEAVAYELPSEEDNYVAGLEWGEAMGADLVSSSLGYLDWYTFDSLDGQTAVTTKAVRIATRLGMVVISSAGNERSTPWGHIIAPADADTILAVGAVTSSGTLASFSSPGPTFDGRIKPDVSAQGVAVFCASPSGTTVYTTKSGTSLSAPLVAGAVALILEARPTWSPYDVWRALRNTASQANTPDNDFGYGIINVAAAINLHPLGTDPPRQSVGKLTLYPIYPNPTNGSRAIVRWKIGEKSAVKIDVYNLLGQHIVNIYNRPDIAAGWNSIVWSGKNRLGQPVPSGLYFVRMTVGSETQVQRLVIRR